jgi:site-specific DNA recombinase
MAAAGLAGFTPVVRCAIYLRVSTEAQAGKAAKAIKAGLVTSMLDLPEDALDKDSLANQERTARAYAAQRGWEVVGVYIELDTSRHWEQRPQMQRLLQDVRAGRVTMVLGWKISRVLRDQNHLGSLLYTLKKFHCGFDLVTENVEDTPVGKFLLQALAFAAELDRDTIRMQTQVGIQGRISQGKLPRPSKRAPYGYRYTPDHGAYLEHPQEAQQVRRIFQDYLAGQSLMQIARALEQDGVATPYHGASWEAATIHNILHRELYATGAVTIHKRGRVAPGEPRLEHKPPEQWITLEGIAPPLITPALYAGVQAQLERSRVHRRRPTLDPEHPLLLVGGYLRCGYCGYAMHRSKAGRNLTTVYKCGNRMIGPGKCIAWNISTAFVDTEVWQRISQRLRDPQLVRAQLLAAQELQQPRIQEQLQALAQEAQDATRAQASILTTIGLIEATNEAALAPLAAELNRLGRRLQAIQEEQQRLEQAQQQAQQQQASVGTFVDSVARAQGRLREAPYALRRLTLEACGVEVTVWKRRDRPENPLQVLAKIPLDGVGEELGPDVFSFSSVR